MIARDEMQKNINVTFPFAAFVSRKQMVRDLDFVLIVVLSRLVESNYQTAL